MVPECLPLLAAVPQDRVVAPVLVEGVQSGSEPLSFGTQTAEVEDLQEPHSNPLGAAKAS